MSNRYSLGFLLPGVETTPKAVRATPIAYDRHRPGTHTASVTGTYVGAAAVDRTIRLTLDLPEWMDQAVCPSVDWEIFHPGRGSNGAEAKAVCALCPVAAECLADAVEYADRHGIRGGTTANQRKPLIEARIAELAARGLRRCEGTCRQIKPVTEFDHAAVGEFTHECRDCCAERWHLEDHTRPGVAA